MKLLTCLLVATLFASSAPAHACGPDTNATAAEDPLANALVVNGSAVLLDERIPNAPVLYVGYPMLPGQTHQSLYGAFFQLVRDRNFERLRPLVHRHRMPHVLLTRAHPSHAWRVMISAPRSRTGHRARAHR